LTLLDSWWRIWLTSATNGTSEMNEEPRPVARRGANKDGLAAVAIIILAMVLIALAINAIV